MKPETNYARSSDLNVAHAGHLKLIVSKIEEKLTGNKEVVFEPDEVARAAQD